MNSLSLVEGVGSEDNNKFELVKNKTLVTKVMFNYEVQVYYSIRLRFQQSGFIKEKVYVVQIQDAQEYPTNIWLSKTEIDFGSVNTIVG